VGTGERRFSRLWGMETNLKVVLIAGAGSGVGRAAAVALSRVGYAVSLAGRTRVKLEATSQLCEGQTQVVAVDLADAEAARGLVDRVVERFGRIDAIVNAAGDARLAPIAQTTPELWRQVIDSNLSYVVHLTAAAWPIFERQGGGIIVNLSSMSSVDPFPGLTLYAAAKTGLNMFTMCTAREGAAIGLRAIALVLGAVETPMLRSLFDEAMLPRELAMSPEEVADVIRDLMTGTRPFESGQTLTLTKQPA